MKLAQELPAKVPGIISSVKKSGQCKDREREEEKMEERERERKRQKTVRERERDCVCVCVTESEEETDKEEEHTHTQRVIRLFPSLLFICVCVKRARERDMEIGREIVHDERSMGIEERREKERREKVYLCFSALSLSTCD
jgi:hypothetical protein